MIWTSTILMTVVDLLILGVISYALVVFTKIRTRLTNSRTRYGFAGIIAGLSLVALFYLADLLTMHVLTLLMPTAKAMMIMQNLHLEYQWVVALFGVGSIALGLAAASRGTLALIGNLEKFQTDLQEELRLRLESEQVHQESEERFRAVVNNSPTKIHIKDVEGRYVLVNREAEKLFGVTDEEARGKMTHELFPDKQADDFREHDQVVLETGQTIAEEEQWKLDDGVHTYLTVKFPIRDGDGEIVAIGAIGTDITERKTAEQELLNIKVHLENQSRELEEMAKYLAHARDHAETANRAKSEFLAAMSHELRTPLNAVIGFSEIIKDEIFGPVGSVKYRDYAEDIHESGQHLLGLINDILDLSKIESGTDELHEDVIEIPEIVRSVLKLVEHRAEQGRVKLELELADQLPPLRADERKVKQILVNLLSNAIKFSDFGGEVALWAWCRKGGGHVFQIIDTGIGIAPKDIPKALSRFGQVDADLNRQYEGTGLGLPLTKALVEQHGGVLDLQSQVGVGTMVTVRFPAERIVASLDNSDSLDAEDRAAS